MVAKTPSLRGGGGLQFAWGASPLLGITLQGNVGIVRTGFVRVAYNGRPEFVVAIDLTFESFNSRALDQNVKFGSLGITLRYYF